MCLLYKCLWNAVDIDVVAWHAGSQGEVDTSEDRQRELVRQRLREKEVSALIL